MAESIFRPKPVDELTFTDDFDIHVVTRISFRNSRTLFALCRLHAAHYLHIFARNLWSGFCMSE